MWDFGSRNYDFGFGKRFHAAAFLNKSNGALYFNYRSIVMKIKAILPLYGLALFVFLSCNHSKPKPISNDVTKTSVAVNGKKDSVINNPQKNYGNATVSEPCVKCLLQVIQAMPAFKTATTSVPVNGLLYKVNWITSSKPVDMGGEGKIVNGMMINVNEKMENGQKKLITYLYNNAKGEIYTTIDQKNFKNEQTVSDTSLKKIRNACFWGVASAK